MFNEMPQRNSKPNPTASSSSRSKRESDGATDCSSNPTKRCDRSIFAGVQDDILIEILLRLPKESLLSSRLVSTRWLNATTEPSFVRSYRSLHPSMLGFFFHLSDEDPPLFVPTARSPDLKEAVERVGSTLDFLPHQSSLRLVDSCGGMLLLDDHSKDRYFICNPLTRDWVEIPHPLSAKRETPFLIGLTCSQKNPSSFQVVRIVKPGKRRSRLMQMNYYDAKVEIFSSGTRTWAITRPMYDYTFMPRLSLDIICVQKQKMQKPPVFVGGVLYWLNRDWQVLAYNEKRSDCPLVALDVPSFGVPNIYHNTFCLSKAEGHLFYAMVETTHLCIWLLTGDYPESKWILKYRIEWCPHVFTIQHLAWIVEQRFRVTGVDFQAGMRMYISHFVRPIGFHCSDSNVVFLSIENKAFSYHLQTRELEGISSGGHNSITLAFPYEMLEFPITIIGTAAEEYTSDY